MIEDDNGYAELKHKCCMRQIQGDIVCSVDDDDLWIAILYWSITVVKVTGCRSHDVMFCLFIQLTPCTLSSPPEKVCEPTNYYEGAIYNIFSKCTGAVCKIKQIDRSDSERASVHCGQVLIFLFCPNFVPVTMYSKLYLASEYVVKLKKDLKMKIFVSERTDAKVRFKHRLTLEEVSKWRRFREFLDSVPYDEILPVKVSELRIKVKIC